MSIQYLQGDATCPQVSGRKIICHVCNNIGGWGKGFVVAVSNRWPETRKEFKAWYKDRATAEPPFELGEVQFLQVEEYIWVGNMIGQAGIKTGSKGPPIRYEAIEACLKKVAVFASNLDNTIPVSIHMPRIGCGLAGGKWELIEPLLEQTLSAFDVYVYDYQAK